MKTDKELEAGARSAEAETGAAPQNPAPQIKVDDSKAHACYANFCRVTGTPEELIIDFALNPQPVGVPTEPIVINQRLVTNFYTAKRLLSALAMTIQRHEQAFGVLETNIQKRITPTARGAT
ncbi:MAG: DUF3467 domain-containing protein [Pirellulales bacterium]|nr:DUF3467 domain-containing protein [Pirellulales bacterium]